MNALSKVYQQYQKALSPEHVREPCTGYFTLNMSLSCAHALLHLIADDKKLALTDIYPRWHYFRSGDRVTERQYQPTPGTLMRIQEPAVLKNTRGRPKRDNRSTKRLPSQFELTRGKKLPNRLPPATVLVAATPAPTLSALPAASAPSTLPAASALPALSTASALTTMAPPPPPSNPPPPTATMPSTAKRTRGPDKKPKKKRGVAGQVQKAPATQAEVGEGNTTRVEGGIITDRALAAAREAAVDKNVAQDNW